MLGGLMASGAFDFADYDRRMPGAVNVLKTELGGLRTGRASMHLLDPVHVPAYGSSMPLNQVGTVSVPEPRMLTVQVWDKSLVGAVDRAIREANLGLNPIVEGQLLRIPIPELNAERRQELDKDGDITEDEHRSMSDKLQKLTDKVIGEIDQALAGKEAEITKV